jgi:hypothetical protein
MSELPVPEERVQPLAVAPPPKCAVCAREISPDAKKCIACGEYRNGTPCRACGHLMPPLVKRCNNCKAFQDWRGNIGGIEVVLALVLSIISVVGALWPTLLKLLTMSSETVVRVAGTRSDPNVSDYNKLLVMAAINSGGRDALIKEVKLDLSSAGIEPIRLDIVNGDKSLVPANGSVTLDLWAGGLVETTSVAEAAAKLCTGKVQLQVDIEEAGYFGKPREKKLSVEIEGRRIYKWALERLPTPTQELDECTN